MSVPRYFACADCKIYLNAGDRWAYWTLEDAGVLVKGELISLQALTSAYDYWHPKDDEDSRWLSQELLPSVRTFMAEHAGHPIVFGDKDDFMFGEGDNYWDDYFNWMQEGWAASTTIRLLVEKLNLSTWEQVCDYVRENPPSWMGHGMREEARKSFEQLVKSRTDNYQ